GVEGYRDSFSTEDVDRVAVYGRGRTGPGRIGVGGEVAARVVVRGAPEGSSGVGVQAVDRILTAVAAHAVDAPAAHGDSGVADSDLRRPEFAGAGGGPARLPARLLGHTVMRRPAPLRPVRRERRRYQPDRRDPDQHASGSRSPATRQPDFEARIPIHENSFFT